jgi:20S proteasome alpha/beta subunit
MEDLRFRMLVNIPNPKNLARAGGRMTYILGANCADGVVLVADRKVTYKENLSLTDYRQKLFGFPSNLYYPIVVGCAGSTVISDQFVEDIKTIALNYNGEIIKVDILFHN